MERVEIIRDLRAGVFDVLVGINLLRGCPTSRKSRWWRFSMPTRKASCVQRVRLFRPSAARRATEWHGTSLCGSRDRSMKNAIAETDRRRAKQVSFSTPNAASSPVGGQTHQGHHRRRRLLDMDGERARTPKQRRSARNNICTFEKRLEVAIGRPNARCCRRRAIWNSSRRRSFAMNSNASA